MDNGRKGKGFFITLIRNKIIWCLSVTIPKLNSCWNWMPETWLSGNYGKKMVLILKIPGFKKSFWSSKSLIPQVVHVDLHWDIPQDSQEWELLGTPICSILKIYWWFWTEKLIWRTWPQREGWDGFVPIIIWEQRWKIHGLGELILVFRWPLTSGGHRHTQRWKFGCFPVKSSSGFMEHPWSTGLLNSSIFPWFECQVFS